MGYEDDDEDDEHGMVVRTIGAPNEGPEGPEGPEGSKGGEGARAVAAVGADGREGREGEGAEDGEGVEGGGEERVDGPARLKSMPSPEAEAEVRAAMAARSAREAKRISELLRLGDKVQRTPDILNSFAAFYTAHLKQRDKKKKNSTIGINLTMGHCWVRWTGGARRGASFRCPTVSPTCASSTRSN